MVIAVSTCPASKIKLAGLGLTCLKTLKAEMEQARPSEVVEYEGIFGPHTTLSLPHRSVNKLLKVMERLTK